MRENRQERAQGSLSGGLDAIEAQVAFGDTEGALEALEERITLQDDSAARRLLASIHRNRGEISDAAVAIEAAATLARTEHARVLCERARIEVESGDIPRAVATFAEAATLAPTLVEAHVGLGSLALHAADPKTAEAHFRTAAQLPGEDGRVRAGLGLSLAGQGRASQAIPEFEAALELDPDAVGALHGMVQAAFQTGETVGAERRVDAYLERHPANVDLWFTAAGLRYRRGDKHAARTALERIRLFDPDYAGLADLGARLEA